MREVLGKYDPSQIPSEWQFPNRDKKGLEVFQLDLGQRFLATNLPDNPGLGFHPEYQDHYGGYFFSGTESAIEERLEHMAHHTGYKRNADLSCNVSVSGRFNYQDMRLVVYLSTFPLEITHADGTWRYETFVDYDGHHTETDVLGTAFAQEVVMTNRLMIPGRGNEGFIGSPGFRLQVRKDQMSGLSTADWVVENLDYLKRNNDSGIGLYYGFSPYQESPNNVLFRDEDNQDIYHMTWEVREEEDIKLLVVEEEHLPTGFKRVVRAPVTIDKGNIIQSFVAQPPYPEGENGFLDIPWRGMEHSLIGASLGYISPSTQKD